MEVGRLGLSACEAQEEGASDLHSFFSTGTLDPELNRWLAPTVPLQHLPRRYHQNGVLKMNIFAKHVNCPSSHEMLSYVEGSLRPLAKQKVARHCAVCDFCGAEAQLFAKYQPSEENYTPAPAPTLVRLLGVQLPLRRSSAVPAPRAA
jgi:hypothetical protein